MPPNTREPFKKTPKLFCQVVYKALIALCTLSLDPENITSGSYSLVSNIWCIICKRNKKGYNYVDLLLQHAEKLTLQRKQAEVETPPLNDTKLRDCNASHLHFRIEIPDHSKLTVLSCNFRAWYIFKRVTLLFIAFPSSINFEVGRNPHFGCFVETNVLLHLTQRIDNAMKK